MKKLWKFAFAVLLAVLVVAALALAACNPNDNPQLPQTPDGGGTGTGSDAKTTYTVTFDANGGRFADNAEKQTNQVESGSKLTAPVSPERTNYTFAGWSKNKNGSDMWKFDTDTVTANTTLYAKWTQTSAVVLSVDGASMDGATIFMFVEHDVDSVPLTDKVVCSDDSTWKLYYDKMGQQPIPTKVAAQMNGFLIKGANVFYILVSSQNGTQENLYELTVYRSYEVPVCYYNGDHLIYTDSCYTGHEYVANYQPNIEGYTFNYWTKGGSQYKTETIWGELNLVANKTANKYDVTFAVNQGNALSEQDQSKTVTYDSTFKLPVPTRTGYSFVGWYSGSTQITAGNGNGLLPWNIADDVQFQAHWQANEYELTVRASNTKAGTVSGTGTYAYDSSVKLTAETNSGYTFVGWFDGDDKISDQLTFNYTMGLAKTIIAKWSKVTLTVNNSSAGSVQQLTKKYKVGDEVQITATTNLGYTFVGWYKEDQQISTDLQCTITMTDSDVTYTAKWSKVTLTVNDSSAGSVQQLTEKYKVGEEVQITAVTKPGYTFVGWYKEDQQISTDLQCTITMTDSDVTYTAKWEPILYNLTFNYDSNIGDFDGDKPTKYTIEGLTLPQLVGKNGNGHFGVKWRDETGKIYTNEIPQGTTGDLTLTLSEWVGGTHTWGSDGKCIYCKALKEPYSEVGGEIKPYTKSSGNIVFGTYPQSKVKDTALQSMLNAEIQNKLPSSDNANGWTDYGYYISGKVQSYMWYVDVEYQGAKYRGVYFTSYRPYYTTDSSSTGNTNQDDNGYNTNKVYWFKWEPLTWRVLNNDGDKALIMADLIIDSQQYYHSTGTRTIGGKTVYASNYKESDIRKWLNADFYNAAFDELSKDFIIQTEVDNSASTTSSSSNQYACENTLDNVFLLSYQDVFKTSYGFKNSTYDTYRQLKTTDYAQCQGAHTATGSYQGFGYWRLRSPSNGSSHSASYVHHDGSVADFSNVHLTHYGVVPALQIQL